MELKLGQKFLTKTEALVSADVDVIVAGGGTAGVVAAIAAARAGAKVLLVEQHGTLGGMMTLGNAGLTKYILHDDRQSEHRRIVSELSRDSAGVQIVGGIPLEITNKLIESGSALGTAGRAGSYVFPFQEDLKLLLLDMIEDAGVQLLLFSQVVDLVMDCKTVRGIVVENKSGRQILLAKIVIDATGDGDVAARAGAPFVLGIGPDDVCAKNGMPLGWMARLGVMFQMAAVNIEKLLDYLAANPDQFYTQTISLQSISEAKRSQASGEMMTVDFRSPSGRTYQIYNNPVKGLATMCCPLYVGDGTDVNDLTRGQVFLTREIHRWAADLKNAVPGFEDSFLTVVPEICVRETRHIQGDYVLSIHDMLSNRKFPDCIGRGSHPIDCGEIPDELKVSLNRWYFEIPYRCLLAREINNVLLAGRCISTTHEAFGCTRTTVECMITGQAAGVAAALSVKQDANIRQLDQQILRKELSEDGVVL